MPTLAPIDVDEERALAGEVVAQPQRLGNAPQPAAPPQKKQPRVSSPPRGVPAAVSSETLDDDDAPQQAAVSAKSDQKRKRSVLEELGAGIDANAIDRFSFANAPATSDSKKKAPKKTIRDFYSLSPKMGAGIGETTPVPTDGSSSKLTPKSTATKVRRVTGKFVALHDEAKPIHVRIPFAGGEAKPTEVVIDSHCVDPKSFAGEKPIELSGSYNPRTRNQMERFLIGFGRYIH